MRRLDAALGGAPAAAAHMAAALGEQGHAVTIATTVARDGRTDEIRQLADIASATTHIEHFPRTRLPFDHSAGLGRWLARHGPSFDLIELHGVFDYPAWHGARQAIRSGRPFVIHPHGSLDPFDLRKHATAKKIIGPATIRGLLARSAAVVVATELEAAALRTYGAHPTIRVVPLPYRSNPQRGDGPRFRRRVEVEEGLLLLFLGRVDANKGLQYLVDAVAVLVRSGFPVTLVVAGDASSAFATELRASVAARALDGAVRFVGHLDEAGKADALAGATLLTLVSDRESYGLVLVEAARVGLPMLVSDQVYLQKELVSAGAAVVVPRDGALVAEELRRLAHDGPRLAAMAEAALHVAHERFDWDVVSQAHSDLRETLVRQWQQAHRH